MKEAWKNGSSGRWLKFADLWIFKKWLLFIQLHGILTTAYKSEESWWGKCKVQSAEAVPTVLAPETSFGGGQFLHGLGGGGDFGDESYIMFILFLFPLLLEKISFH